MVTESPSQHGCTACGHWSLVDHTGEVTCPACGCVAGSRIESGLHVHPWRIEVKQAGYTTIPPHREFGGILRVGCTTFPSKLPRKLRVKKQFVRLQKVNNWNNTVERREKKLRELTRGMARNYTHAERAIQIAMKIIRARRHSYTTHAVGFALIAAARELDMPLTFQEVRQALAARGEGNVKPKLLLKYAEQYPLPPRRDTALQYVDAVISEVIDPKVPPHYREDLARVARVVLTGEPAGRSPRTKVALALYFASRALLARMEAPLLISESQIAHIIGSSEIGRRMRVVGFRWLRRYPPRCKWASASPELVANFGEVFEEVMVQEEC